MAYAVICFFSDTIVLVCVYFNVPIILPLCYYTNIRVKILVTRTLILLKYYDKRDS